jgi:hypothetical protein
MVYSSVADAVPPFEAELCIRFRIAGLEHRTLVLILEKAEQF